MMEGNVMHADRFDERLEHDAPIEIESLQPVAPVDFLRNERAEQLDPLSKASAAFQEPADKRLGVERRNADRISFVEQEHGVDVDLPHEELVRGG